MDKTQELFMGVGRQLPDLLNNLGFDTIIHRSNNVVKGRICCRLRGRKNEKFSQTANFNKNKNRIIAVNGYIMRFLTGAPSV